MKITLKIQDLLIFGALVYDQHPPLSTNILYTFGKILGKEGKDIFSSF